MTDFVSNINSTSIGGDNFDGQWIQNPLVLAIGVSYADESFHTYSLASYLPNDEYDYEVLFSGEADTGSKSGNNTRLFVYSGTISSATNYSGWLLGAVAARTAATRNCGSSAIVPIFADDRNVTFAHRHGAGAVTAYIGAFGYRRIGKND